MGLKHVSRYSCWYSPNCAIRILLPDRRHLYVSFDIQFDHHSAPKTLTFCNIQRTMDQDIYVIPYYPDGVKQIIATGGQHYIGLVNESTVLKYPHFREEGESLRAESKIFQRLGKHPRIIEFRGEHDGGLLLEYAPNGTLETYLKEVELLIKERIRLAKETAEGVSHVHSSNVLICDIHVRNILLDAEMHVKLCDFQGRLLSPEGEVLVSGDRQRTQRRSCLVVTSNLQTSRQTFSLLVQLYII